MESNGKPKTISREELMKMANLSDADLTKAVGGVREIDLCQQNCKAQCKSDYKKCIRSQSNKDECSKIESGCYTSCTSGCLYASYE